MTCPDCNGRGVVYLKTEGYGGTTIGGDVPCHGCNRTGVIWEPGAGRLLCVFYKDAWRFRARTNLRWFICKACLRKLDRNVHPGACCKRKRP